VNIATPVRILIVDDHPVVRLGIRQMIAEETQLVVACEAEDGESALRLVKTESLQLAIVDLSLRDGGGLGLLRALREAAPHVSLLVLSMHDEALFAERVLRAGARGYIMKQEAIGGLVQAIQQVLAGRVFISDRMSQRMLERVANQGGEPSSALARLTDRELEVFELFGRGLSAASIANTLEVSLKTVETYRANIKTKLGLKDATDVIRFAARWAEEL
jgi:DNA-binding NarL/FixJ family response regulator